MSAATGYPSKSTDYIMNTQQENAILSCNELKAFSLLLTMMLCTYYYHLYHTQVPAQASSTHHVLYNISF